MSEPTPALLDVVPWNHGYAHTWALAWLIQHEPARDRVLRLLDPKGTAPWTLTRDVAREHKLPGARAVSPSLPPTRAGER